MSHLGIVYALLGAALAVFFSRCGFCNRSWYCRSGCVRGCFRRPKQVCKSIDYAASARYTGYLWSSWLDLLHCLKSDFRRRNVGINTAAGASGTGSVSSYRYCWIDFRKSQGKTSAAAIGIVAKKPEQFGKAMLFPAMVETYAILALLISILAVTNLQF